MSDKKIVFITPSIKTGGGNRVFIELANELCIKNKVFIVYPNNSKQKHTFILHPVVDCKGIGKIVQGKISKVLNIFKTIRYINKAHYNDHIIISDPIFVLFFFLIKGKHKYRFMQADDYRIYDDGLVLGKGLLLALYKRLCLCGYKAKINFIFNSKYVYDCYVKDAKRPDTSFFLVHPAINHNIFNSHGRKKNDEKQKKVISLVARQHPWKGLVTFINVYKKLSNETKNLIQEIILISHDDLSDFDTTGMKIVTPTNDLDIASVYQQSDIFVSTSWWEGFGLPPLEAMACGCAVITSDSGGVNEYAKNNENCLMFKPKEEKDLIEKIIQLIDDNKLIEKLIGGSMITAQQFTWKTSAEKLIEILSK